MFDFDIGELGGFAFGNGTEFIFTGCDTRLETIHGEPAWFDENFSGGQEGIGDITVFDTGDPAGVKKLGGGIKYGKEAFGDEVEDFFSGFVEFNKTSGRDDRKVIGDFGVVKDTLARDDELLLDRVFGVAAESSTLLGNGFNGAVDFLDVVFRKIAGIGPGVGEHFVFLVERLRNLEGAFGGEAIA